MKTADYSTEIGRRGAVHNHEGAETYMVNCIVAGNSSTKEGGGIFNSRHTGEELAAKMYLHNCLIAGNEADGPDDDDMGGGVFNGLANSTPLEEEAFMELINCTLVGNHAGGSYGGAVNFVSNSTLEVYNAISWDNSDDDGGTGTRVEQLEYAAGFTSGDADQNVVEACDNCFGGGDNKDDDPVFADTTSTAVWTVSAFDADAGLTTFTVASISGNSTPNDLFFQPDTTPLQLLIKEIVANTSIVCYGWWVPMTDQNQTGHIFDYHTDDTGGGYNYGDGNYYPLDDGVCDLDPGPHPTLEVDLDLVARTGNPDSGAYEDN